MIPTFSITRYQWNYYFNITPEIRVLLDIMDLGEGSLISVSLVVDTIKS